MADHDYLYPVVDPVLKRDKCSVLQLFQRIVHIRITFMGVSRGSPMSGKMFVHSDNPLSVQPFQFRGSHLRHKLRI